MSYVVCATEYFELLDFSKLVGDPDSVRYSNDGLWFVVEFDPGELIEEFDFNGGGVLTSDQGGASVMNIDQALVLMATENWRGEPGVYS